MTELCTDVLQFRLVKADGSIAVANKCKNKDLFWALRGGGGSTWGVSICPSPASHRFLIIGHSQVVLKVTYKTHPPLKSISAIGFTINTTDSKSMTELSEVFISSIPNISDLGISCLHVQAFYNSHLMT